MSAFPLWSSPDGRTPAAVGQNAAATGLFQQSSALYNQQQRPHIMFKESLLSYSAATGVDEEPVSENNAALQGEAEDSSSVVCTVARSLASRQVALSGFFARLLWSGSSTMRHTGLRRLW